MRVVWLFFCRYEQTKLYLCAFVQERQEVQSVVESPSGYKVRVNKTEKLTLNFEKPIKTEVEPHCVTTHTNAKTRAPTVYQNLATHDPVTPWDYSIVSIDEIFWLCLLVFEFKRHCVPHCSTRWTTVTVPFLHQTPWIHHEVRRWDYSITRTIAPHSHRSNFVCATQDVKKELATSLRVPLEQNVEPRKCPCVMWRSLATTDPQHCGHQQN